MTHLGAGRKQAHVRPLLQLETVTSVLVIRSDKQFSFQITTARGRKMTALRIGGGRDSRWTVTATAKLRGP